MKRLSLREVFPASYVALGALETAQKSMSLPVVFRDLIKIRASQINGCSYCVDLHVREALDHGIEARKLHLVAVWREVSQFSPEEKAVLALAEAVTRLPEGVPDAVWDNAVQVLGEQQVAEALFATIAINAWNRVGVSTGMTPA